MGTVPPQGTYTDNPDTNRVYILTAYNGDNQAATKQFPVTVAVVGRMVKPLLHRTDTKPRPTQGDTVTFSWEAKNAQEMRIVGAGSTIQLEGSSGQKRAKLKAKGTYSFTLIAKDDKGNEVASDPVSFEAFCTIRDTGRCKDTPMVEWIP